MKDTISQLLNQCLRDLTAITDSGSLVRYEAEVSYRRWLDELGRLRVWSGNIGAHQTGQSSLDYRLRDASHLREETTRLLSRLVQIFQDLSEVINEYDEEAIDIEIEDDDEDNSMTEVQQLYQSITDTINSLFQISMAIRSPADHDRLLNIRIKDDSFFEPWARQHVSQKYPDAEDALISRLGRAMARQKAILKYRERHRAKLGKGLFGDIETTSTKLSETVATEIAPDIDHLQFLDTASHSGLSQTSYATSLMETKTATSIPKPPKVSKNRSPFECPYCFHIIVIKHKKDWARHIFRDVMPYVCLSMNCATPSRLYESRHQWFSHMREAHAQGQNGLACPLCHAEIQVLSSFEKHVGRHLEELALFFLPPTDVDEEEASDATPSVPSINHIGSDNVPASAFNQQAVEDSYLSGPSDLEEFGSEDPYLLSPSDLEEFGVEDPYLSGPSDLEGFGFEQQQHISSAYSADPPSRLSSLSPAVQKLSSETNGLQVPIEQGPSEEKSNINTRGTQSRVDAIDARGLDEEDISASSRGSSNARTRPVSDAEVSSRLEDGDEFTMTMNGMTIGFTSHSVSRQRIFSRRNPTVPELIIEERRPKRYITLSRRDDHPPVRELNIEGTRAKKYIDPSREHDEPALPELIIEGRRQKGYLVPSREYTTLNSASRRAISADGHARHTPEATFEGEPVQVLKTREYEVQGGKSSIEQERWNKLERVESTLEDDMVSQGREWQHIGASQPLNVDTVTKGSELSKPPTSVRHQNRRNRPQVIQVSRPTFRPDSLERNTVAPRPDMRRRKSEDTFDRDPGYREYAHATRKKTAGYHADPFQASG